MTANANLHKAKTAKNDEFYTQLTDISNELKHYKQHFAGATVLCNCDDPTWSAFWKYFHLNFEKLGLKKLVSTHYDRHEPTYKMTYDGCDDDNIETGVTISLEGNGDFRNQECLDLLDDCDIVVTNPPFSLFREYVKVLIAHGKKFIIIGNLNAITYKEFFPLLKNNQVWAGMTFNKTMDFIMPDDYILKGKAYIDDNGKKHGFVPGICWYTNLDITKRHEKLILWKSYTPEEYPKYDNYDAININKITDIPVDYDGIMGVPITFLDRFNPDQFEIIGGSQFDDTSCRIDKNYTELGYKFLKSDGKTVSGSGALRDRMSPKIPVKGNGDYSVSPTGEYLSAVYQRLFIRKKTNI